MGQRLLLLCFALTAATASAQPAGQGTIAGVIRYTGEVPPSQRIMTTDGAIIMHNDIVVDKKSKGLRDVIVVLDWKDKVPAEAKAKPKPIVVDQIGMIFIPRVVTVTEGQKVHFENSDNCNHCVDAKSVLSENSFNVGSPMGKAYVHAFKAQKNPIPIGCVLHPWMRAYVLVAHHPYHAVTAADGTFKIDAVPAGKHTLQFIHPDTNYRQSMTVEVQAGKTAPLELEWKSLKR